MFTALLSFFGGNAFRMLWGEISAKWTAYQDHKHEIEMVKLQAQIAGEQHLREMESIRLQHDLQVQVVRVQGEADVARSEANAWEKAVEGTTKPSGIWLVDLWNGVIRPLGATFFLILIGMHFYEKQWVLDEQGWALAGAFLGIYVADRTLFKRGK